MKNFLDLQDIDRYIDLIIEVEPIIDNGEPTVEIFLNNECIFGKGPLASYCKIYTRVNLLEPINVMVLLSNKQYNAKQETAIVVKNLSIDNINIIPNYNHLIEYYNDHNINPKSNYLGFNGIWIFDTKAPFYQWLHQAQGQGWLLSP